MWTIEKSVGAYEELGWTFSTPRVGVVETAAGRTPPTHVFRFAGWWVLTRARSPVRLLWGLVFVSGGFSALLLNERFPGRGIVRGLVLIPWLLPPVVNGGAPEMCGRNFSATSRWLPHLPPD